MSADSPPPMRIPPHNLQAEESLLGAMLLSRDAIAEAVESVAPDDFYKPAHAHVFDAICSLYGAGEPADTVTVAEELSRADLLESIGGPNILVHIQSATPAATNASKYAGIVHEYALLRRLIGAANDIAELGYSAPDDVIKAVDEAEARIYQIAQGRAADTLAQIRDLLDANLDRLEQLYEQGDAITGLATGYQDLDEILSGLQPSTLVVVGARPAMGKTSFAAGAAAHAALEQDRPVLFFSLEMSQLEISQRLLCGEARVDATHVRNGNLTEEDWSRISHAVGRLAEAPVWIDDNPNLTVMEIRAKARRLKSRIGDLGMVVVDYLQLMTGRSSAENRQVEVAEISRGLKILAREIETPVVALSQLSRNLELRSDKRPVLADLRECLTGDTLIARADTGEQVPIRHLVGQRDVPVWSFDEQLRTVPARMREIWPTGERMVYRVELASGRSITATDNHPLRCPEGWTKVADLGAGRRLAVAPDASGAGTAAGWDEVRSIESVGFEPVFDASVPGTHCFVANGVVSHNSGAIEQDADVVMFLYRDEIYNPESSDVGTAEVIVAKHRTGPTGTVRLAFLPRYTRFANMARTPIG